MFGSPPAIARCGAVAAAVFAFLAVSSAVAACPPSEISFYGNGPILSTATSYDSTVGSSTITFDIPAGNLTLDQCCSLANTSINVRDEFDVTGVPMGTPVTMTAQMIADCFVIVTCETGDCSGFVVDSLQHVTDVDALPHEVNGPGRFDFHDVLSVPLTIVAGTPELLSFELEGHRVAGNTSESGGSANITFSGLPPGVNIVSCKGYSLFRVTPVHRTSWGELKTIYR
jgi:hypothetical protein